MSGRGWLNLGMLLAALLLTTLVYFEPGMPSQARVRLYQLDRAAVQQIKVERDGAETLLLQRRGPQWWLLEPAVVAAKPYYVEQLLDMLSRESLQRYPAEGLDLSKYGLQPPRARLSLDGVELAFGRINPLNNRLYVMVDNVMHMVLQNDISLLTTDWFEYVATAPFAGMELVGLELPGLGQIRRDEQGWRYEGDQVPASADQLQMLVDVWQQAQAVQVRPVSKAVATEMVVMQLAGGEVLRLGLSRSPEGLALQYQELGLEYVFDEAQAKRLLQWPGLAAAENDD